MKGGWIAEQREQDIWDRSLLKSQASGFEERVGGKTTLSTLYREFRTGLLTVERGEFVIFK